MQARTRRRATLAGNGSGGVVASDRNTPADYGESGPSTSSLTLAAIDTDLNVTIDVSEGDLLLVVLTGTFGTNNGSPVAGLFNYTIDDVTQFADDLEHLIRGVDSELISWTDTHVVTAGEITAGQVTVVPVWGSTSMALQLRPTFSVINLGAAA